MLLDSGEVRSFLIDSDLFLYSDLEILCDHFSDRTKQSVGWHRNRNLRAVLFKCDHSVSLAQSLRAQPAWASAAFSIRMFTHPAWIYFRFLIIYVSVA